MSAFESAQMQPLVTAVGWALLHFVWQGALVAALLAGVMVLLRERAANARYLAACAAMVLMLVLPVATAVWIERSSVEGATSGLLSTRAVSPLSPAPSNVTQQELRPGWWTHSWRQQAITRLDGTMPLLISVWLLGVLAGSLRLMGGWISVLRLSRRKARPAAPQWHETLQGLAARLRVTQPVRLIESALVQVPTAIGWLRPVIILPASAFTGLTPQQLEAILTHELAHVRRHDYLVNLLQRAIEALLFYHPAVWWVSRQIRIEREYCCDNLAVAACGDVLVYARALAVMEQMRAAPPQVAVAVNGGLLLHRIHRLVGTRQPRSNGLAGPLAALIAILAVGALATGVRGLSSTISPHSELSQDAKQIAVEKLLGTWKAKSNKAPNLTAGEITVRANGNELTGSSNKPVLPAVASSDRSDDETSFSPEGAETLRQFGEQAPGTLRSLLRGQDVESLLAALNDEEFQVRDNAIAELGKLGERRAVEPLISLLDDPNVYIRDNAINSLGLIGDGRAVAPLLEALGDQNVYIRDNAITALGRLRDPRAVEPLIALLADHNVYLRDNAASALGEIGDRRALEPLRSALNDENWYVRQTAAKSLQLIPGN